MSYHTARRLRPYLFHGFKQVQCTASTRAFTRCSVASKDNTPKEVTNDYEKRLRQLDAYKPRDEWYPRMVVHPKADRTRAVKFHERNKSLVNEETRSYLRMITGTVLLDV